MSVAGSRSRPLNRAVGTVNLSPYSAHSVAGVLKLYFREMPEPLMTFELYPDFLAIARTQRIARSLARLHTLTLAHGVVCHVRACASRTGQYEYGNARLSEELINCLRRLPEAHYPLAVYLLRFLKARRHSHHPGTLTRSYTPVSSRSHSACMSRVNCGDRCISTYVQEASKFSAQSKMGIDNLAMVFAPNVLRARNETLQQIMEDTNYIKIVLRSLIEACDRL